MGQMVIWWLTAEQVRDLYQQFNEMLERGELSDVSGMIRDTIGRMKGVLDTKGAVLSDHVFNATHLAEHSIPMNDDLRAEFSSKGFTRHAPMFLWRHEMEFLPAVGGVFTTIEYVPIEHKVTRA